MDLLGKMVRCQTGEELVFLWDTETLTESDDADAQETARGNWHGVVAVNALYNPRRFSFVGKFLVRPNRWTAAQTVAMGDVLEEAGFYYQAGSAGTTGSSAPTFGGATVADNGLTWNRRGNLYECLRWIRDQFDAFFHAGLIQLYLDSDRYHFAQCTARSFRPMNADTALEWDATFSAPDPRRHDIALTTLAQATASPQTIWTAGASYLLAAVVVLPSDNGRAYACTAAGRSAPNAPHGPFTAPVWQASTLYALGDVIRPATPNGKVYVCTRAGTSGVSAPPFGTVALDDPDAGGCQWTPASTFIDQNTERWVAGRSYSLGNIVTPAVPNGWLYTCVRAGTAGSTAPTWPTTESAQVDDPDAAGCRWEAHKAAVWEYSGLANQRSVTLTATYAGNAPGEPTVRLTVPACELDIVVANLDTGQEFTIRGATAAGVLTIDGDTGDVYLGTDTDMTPLWDGEHLSLAPGQNRIQVAWNEPGPTLCEVLFRNRWW